MGTTDPKNTFSKVPHPFDTATLKRTVGVHVQAMRRQWLVAHSYGTRNAMHATRMWVQESPSALVGVSAVPFAGVAVHVSSSTASGTSCKTSQEMYPFMVEQIHRRLYLMKDICLCHLFYL